MGTEGLTAQEYGFGRVVNPEADGRLLLIWTSDKIIEFLKDYEQLYGGSTAACFNPSGAKWSGRPDLRERYIQGNPLKDGHPWPSLNTIKSRFLDPSTGKPSFDQARIAAGLGRNRTGPAKGRRPAGKHAPIRDIRDRVVVLPPERARTALLRAQRAEDKNRRLQTKVNRLERRLEQRVAQIAMLEAEIAELRGAAAAMVEDLAL